jgi:hypothetical protein
MSELDDLVKVAGIKSKKKQDMAGARDGAEQIREWVSLTQGLSRAGFYFLGRRQRILFLARFSIFK